MPEDKVVSLDEALLQVCSGEEREQLLGEAILLVDAFAPEGRSPELMAIAHTLTVSAPGDRADRRHARKLAATLREMARTRAPHRRRSTKKIERKQ